METFSALLDFMWGTSVPASAGPSHKRPVMWSYAVLYSVILNMLLMFVSRISLQDLTVVLFSDSFCDPFYIKFVFVQLLWIELLMSPILEISRHFLHSQITTSVINFEQKIISASVPNTAQHPHFHPTPPNPLIAHAMMTSSDEHIFASLAICAGIHRSPVVSPSQKPEARSFDVFFDLRLNKRLSTQSRRRWFETPSRSLWRKCNAPSGDRKSVTHFIAACQLSTWYVAPNCESRASSRQDFSIRHPIECWNDTKLRIVQEHKNE